MYKIPGMFWIAILDIAVVAVVYQAGRYDLWGWAALGLGVLFARSFHLTCDL